jgi:microsomal epoxide hydrolase
MVYTPPTSAKPYTLAFPDDAISSLSQLLRLSPIGPATYENQQTEHNYGITQKWLIDTKQYWLDTYDFRAQEKHINSFPNYTMQIEDLNIHFIALFSEKEDAIPIIMMHGWPGSFIEFLPLAGLIRDKYSAKDLPYHIIIPSLPGYTLSSGPLVDKDFSKDDTARIMNKLMTNLGFDKYIAQGGDVGSFVAETMAHEYDACVAVHCMYPEFYFSKLLH